MARLTFFLFVAVLVLSKPGYGQLPQSTVPDDPNDPAFEYSFPDGFLFSSATASYQVEGGWNASGKSENIWDRTTHEHPEYIMDRSNGDVACDSYHKFKEDIRLAKEMGTKMYRFSISWSRVLPTGAIDVVNPDGIRYYHDVIDECIANDIIPMVTIFHWDLPQSLQDLGGLTNEVLIDYIVDYCEFIFETYGHKVQWWLTLNEPWTMCAEGYGTGLKAPAIKSDGRGDYLCAHYSLIAHARVYHLYQTKFKPTQKGQIGLAANCDYFWPKDPTDEADVRAAERWQQFNLGWFLHPVFSTDGDYPAVLKEYVGNASRAQGLKRSRLPSFTQQEINDIKGSADFMGINIYTSTVIEELKPWQEHAAVGTRIRDANVMWSRDPSWEPSIAPWFYVVPKGMRMILNWMKNEYNNPKVIITEHGYPDGGELKDVKRVRYYRLYLLELLKAIREDNCNIFGYTAWSLLDNFEWFYGYAHHFGLHLVDFQSPNRTRTPKMSAKFFQQLIATRKIPRDGTIVYPDDDNNPTTTRPTNPTNNPTTTRPTNPTNNPTTTRPTNPTNQPDNNPTNTPDNNSAGAATGISTLIVAALCSALSYTRYVF